MPHSPQGTEAFERPVSPWTVFAAWVVALAVACLMSSGALLDWAERQPYGQRRTAFVAAALPVRAVSAAVGQVIGSGHFPGTDAATAGSARLARATPVARLVTGPTEALDESPPPTDAAVAVPTSGLDGPLPHTPAQHTPEVDGSDRPSAMVAATGLPSGGKVVRTEPLAAPLLEAALGQPSPTLPAHLPVAASPVAVIAVSTLADPPPPRRLDSTAPLRVHVAGDSMAQPIGYALMAAGVETGMLAVDQDIKIASSLTRPDYFDWPGRLAETAQREPPPEAVVIFIGANDNQHLLVGDRYAVVGTPEWTAEYGRRAASIMDTFAGIARVYWIGQPVMSDPARNAVAGAINGALAVEAAPREWARIIDIWGEFADESGAYRSHLPGQTGEMVLMRQPDGIHLSTAGSHRLAELVRAAIEADLDTTLDEPAIMPAAGVD